MILRLPRLSTGLPYAQLWDEPQVLGTALRMFKTHDLDPHFSPTLAEHQPAVPVDASPRTRSCGHSARSRRGRAVDGGRHRLALDAVAPDGVVHGPAAMPTLLALGSISAVYRVGVALSRRGHRSGAAFSASLLAANVMLIEHSTIGTVDSVTAFFDAVGAGTGALLCPAQPAILAVAGHRGGTLCSCKYNAGVVIFPTLWAVIHRAEGPLLGSRAGLVIGTLALCARLLRRLARHLGLTVGVPQRHDL